MDHKDLDAWKQAMLLVEDVYKVAAGFPKEEIYGLTAQMRRSAVSVPSNLSEGAARKSDKELNNFLSISLGSLAELETQLLIASRLGYANVEAVLERVNRVRALILGLRNHVRRKKRETGDGRRET
jgi:four helix bundle protein